MKQPANLALHMFVTGIALLAASWAFAEEPNAAAESSASYYRDVRPILQRHCQGCHQPAKAGGSYVLTDFAAISQAGDSGEDPIVPGDPEVSYLLAMITPEEGKAAMPLNQPPLSDDQIAAIRAWIKAGAENDAPEDATLQIDADHPPVYEAPPVITSLDFSPDGKLLAVAGYHEILLYDAADWKLAGRLVGLSERVQSVAFSPDGTLLAAAGGSPGRLGELQIWDVAAGSLAQSIQVGYDTIYGASWSPDGKIVACGCPDNTVRAFDAATGAQVLFQGAHNDWVIDTVFSVDGGHLVSVSRDMTMKLIDVPTERFVDNITSITPGALRGGLHAVDRHPTKNELLIGGADGVPARFRMFRQEDQQRKIGDDYNRLSNFDAMPGRVYDVTYSPDGELSAAVSSDDGAGQARIYKTETGSLVAKYESSDGGLYAASFSPDGERLAVAGFAGTVRVLNATNGEVEAEFRVGPTQDQPTGSLASDG